MRLFYNYNIFSFLLFPPNHLINHFLFSFTLMASFSLMVITCIYVYTYIFKYKLLWPFVTGQSTGLFFPGEDFYLSWLQFSSVSYSSVYRVLASWFDIIQFTSQQSCWWYCVGLVLILLGDIVSQKSLLQYFLPVFRSVPLSHRYRSVLQIYPLGFCSTILFQSLIGCNFM